MNVQGLEEFDGADYASMPQLERQPSPKNRQPKTLKFVTNYGAPHPKRRRVAAACLTCRKRKTACSGERPACETCLQNRLDCAGYAADAPAPGHKRTASEAYGHEAATGDNEADDRPRKASFQQIEREPEVEPDLRRTTSYEAGGPAASTWSIAGATSGSTILSSTVDKDTALQTVEAAADQAKKAPLFSGPRNRMPYFRWLGPTAVAPGFKQVVVKVSRQDPNRTHSSSDGAGTTANRLSPTMKNIGVNGSDPRISALLKSDAAAAENNPRSPLTLPFYDDSPMPPSELITHLVNTFFTHLGCNYPFLQRTRFLRDLEEKQVDAILVDAVCALAARFSTHSLLTQQSNIDESKTPPAEYGHAFAQRAQTALMETFFCPTVAAVQAALLLAYNEFGENRDSGLWIYLGISIRMAQDLGLHKIEGLKYRGKTGPTPKAIKKESMNGAPQMRRKMSSNKRDKDNELERLAREKVVNEGAEHRVEVRDHSDGPEDADEQKAVEQERVDTFWGLFFLDRVVSCGTGRISTIRDKDVEISFPPLDETDPRSGWPAPYPALIRIVHLYGRVADLLNSIKEPGDITSETPTRLASMERQVTNFYQGLSPRLHFDAVNFQHYMKAGEGTNFVLLHFWFHTLIVLLHQPTLLKTFEGRMLQLFPNSQQLSMSSAKTIADILSYSQLMDAKASLGNPFTAQPIYVAACAFLRETAAQTATSNNQSRESSPGPESEKKDSSENRPPSMNGSPVTRQQVSISDHTTAHHSTARYSPTAEGSVSSMNAEKHESSDKSRQSGFDATKTASALARHTLLATAASQHYQLCYKALEAINTYWAGAKYILTVLDQKREGVRDPLLYTAEEGESAMERLRTEPAFTSPGWRKTASWGPYIYGPNVRGADFWRERAGQMAGSPSDPSKAIGWTLTGTMNSPNTNLAWHYPSAVSASPQYEPQQRPRSQPTRETPEPNTSMPSLRTDFAPAEPPPRARSASSNIQQVHALPGHQSGNAIAISDSGNATYLPNMQSQFQQNNNAGNANPNESAFAMHPPGRAGPHEMNNSHQQQAQHQHQHEHQQQHHQQHQHQHQHQAHHRHHSSSSHHQYPGGPSDAAANDAMNPWNYDSIWNVDAAIMPPFGDMMIESQDIDMNLLGLDTMPWFDAAGEYAGFFDAHAGAGHHSPGEHGGGGR